MLYGVGAVVQAVAVRRVSGYGSSGRPLVAEVLREPMWWLVAVLYLSGFGFHLLALRLLPLYLAQAGISASLAVTAVLAVCLLGDQLGWQSWAAVVAVCGGLALLALASGEVGTSARHANLPETLAGAFVVLVVVGASVSRSEGVVATALLGLLAGLGFGGDSIAVRLLPDLDPGSMVKALPSYLLLAFGAMAFLFYSLALRRGSVTLATAPMIVAQTVAPAVFGLVFLGDTVRSGGWQIGAVAGLLLTCAGAVALARFEAVSPPAGASPEVEVSSKSC